MAEEQANFDYKPDAPKSAAKKASARKVIWTASEYIDHQRGASWYLLLVMGTAVLAALVYLLTKDYFATGIIIVVGLILGSVAHWKPRQVNYELSSSGFQADEKFYPFSLFK